MKFTRRSKKQSNGNNRNGWVENNFSVPRIFDDLLTRDFFQPSFSSTGVSTPAVNIIETSDAFRLEMVAPGMKKGNFNVELDNEILTISYDHEDNREGESGRLKYITREYNYHSFTRSFTLPETVQTDKIQARYEDGILSVTVPKSEEAKGQPLRQIKIS